MKERRTRHHHLERVSRLGFLHISLKHVMLLLELLAARCSAFAGLNHLGTGREVANESDPVLGIDQTQLLGGLGPVRPPSSGACRLGRHEVCELLLDGDGHLRAQSALHVRGAHILRGLVQTHHASWKVRRSLLAARYRQMGTMPTSDANLADSNGLVPASRVGGEVVFCGLECLDLMTKEDLVVTELKAVFGLGEDGWETLGYPPTGRAKTVQPADSLPLGHGELKQALVPQVLYAESLTNVAHGTRVGETTGKRGLRRQGLLC